MTLTDRLKDAGPVIDAMIGESAGQTPTLRTVGGRGRRRPAVLIFSAAAALLVAGGVAAVLSRPDNGSEVTAVGAPSTTADGSEAYVYRPMNGRGPHYISNLSDLVSTSDAVALVTVQAENIKTIQPAEDERVDQRFLTLKVDQTLTGKTLPDTVELYESMTTVSQGSAHSTNGWRIDVGDQLVVALSAQPGDAYEFNGGLAFFPYNDPAAAAEVANGRVMSVDPAAKAIGEATRNVSDQALLELMGKQG